MSDGRQSMRVGETVTFSKTVGECDVYLFAGITGDMAPNHVDESYMATTRYGRRIAHGVLLLGYASTASTLLIQRHATGAVSYGYERVRFVAPVFIGDTITVVYTLERIDDSQGKSYAKIEIWKQDRQLCLVATHILKFIPVAKGLISETQRISGDADR